MAKAHNCILAGRVGTSGKGWVLLDGLRRRTYLGTVHRHAHGVECLARQRVGPAQYAVSRCPQNGTAFG